MTKLIRACIAMAAFAAIFVIPSAASAKPELTHPTGTTIPAGTKLMATNVAHSATGKPTRFTAGGLEVVCQTATLTGELEKNTGTHIAGNITTAEFFGKVGNHNTGSCESNLGDVVATPTHLVNPEHEGKKSLPWCVTANELNDKLTIRGGKCSEAARPLFFTLHPPGFSCTYSRASLIATYTTHPADAVATVDGNQHFKKVTGGLFCPNEGTLDMAFTLTTDENGVSGAPIYIS